MEAEADSKVGIVHAVTVRVVFRKPFINVQKFLVGEGTVGEEDVIVEIAVLVKVIRNVEDRQIVNGVSEILQPIQTQCVVVIVELAQRGGHGNSVVFVFRIRYLVKHKADRIFLNDLVISRKILFDQVHVDGSC
jgi:hypothetical protein